MTVKLLTEHHLGFLSLKGGCIGLSESTLVKMPDCWRSNVASQLCVNPFTAVYKCTQYAGGNRLF